MQKGTEGVTSLPPSLDTSTDTINEICRVQLSNLPSGTRRHQEERIFCFFRYYKTAVWLTLHMDVQY